MKSIALLLSFSCLFLGNLRSQAVHFLEGGWEDLNSCARCEPCNDSMSDMKELSKSIQFFQNETLIDEWFLIKQEIVDCEKLTYRTLAKSGYNSRESVFDSKEDALLDIYWEVREKYPSAEEIRWMESPHEEIALFTIQHFLDPFPTPENTRPKVDTELTYKVVETMPVFRSEYCADLTDQKERKACGDQIMLEYIYKNIKYPAEARKDNIEGSVIIQFVVNTEGYLENISIIRDIGGGCGEEAARVVESMNDLAPGWEPGLQRGEKVKVQFNLPIRFRL